MPDTRPSGPGGGMELLLRPEAVGSMGLPGSMSDPLALAPCGEPPLRGTTLSRMDELYSYLRQCDDVQSFRNYFKVLSTCPRALLDDIASLLKQRCAWLAMEEAREYKRAKVLNVMGKPRAPLPAPSPGTAAGAAAFCSRVLAGDDDLRPSPMNTPARRRKGVEPTAFQFATPLSAQRSGTPRSGRTPPLTTPTPREDGPDPTVLGAARAAVMSHQLAGLSPTDLLFPSEPSFSMSPAPYRMPSHADLGGLLPLETALFRKSASPQHDPGHRGT